MSRLEDSTQTWWTRFTNWVQHHPLLTLIVIAAVLRIIATVFARGYMASDDHFLVIQPAADWLNGIPSWFDSAEPIKRGVLYPYTVFAVMWVLKIIGITDPATVMFVQRFLHGAWSLLSVALVYIYVKRFADDRAAFSAGLLMAAHFLLPFLAVRNLVEVVCQPFVMAGLLFADRSINESRSRLLLGFLAGIGFGFAFMIRIQTAAIPLGVFFLLLVRRNVRPLLGLTLGGLLMLLLEGLLDYLSFGVFLSSVTYSLTGQAKIIHEYVTGPWYTYIGTIAGVLIPPFSLLALYWMVRAQKRVPAAFWGILLFLVVHSIIPQKQERFILPAMPALFSLAAIGWSMVKWRFNNWVRGIWFFMWIVNLLLLPIGLFNFSQRARIEPLLELNKMDDAGGVVVATIDNPQWLPYYYAGYERDDFYYVQKPAQLDTLTAHIASYQHFRALPDPTHVLLLTHKDPELALPKLEQHLGGLELVKHTGPSLADWLLHKMNPKFNHSKESWLYRLVRPNESEISTGGDMSGNPILSQPTESAEVSEPDQRE